MRLHNFKSPGLFILLGVAIGLFLGYLFVPYMSEGFTATKGANSACVSCGALSCPPNPDMSKYVLKSSIPPNPTCPEMTNYMLKTECPPTPDLSQYVLKSSIPNPEPVIVDNSACGKDCGECPACPRPRCPEVKCPPPTVCPACPPCERQKCPQPVVKCKAEESPSTPVRPFLAPLNFGEFGK
jgi:hypothetical protein